MSGPNDLPAVPESEVPDRPRVVDEADEVLSTYTWQIVGASGLAVAIWAGLVFMGGFLFIPITWLFLTLAVLVVLYFAPVAREPKLAREVLRRWDELRVERALESAGMSDDPRLEVGRSMAERVVRHPSVEERVRRTAAELLRRLEILLKDLRRVQWLADARSAADDSRRGRSISDLIDVLDARIANVLGQLAELHRTVVLRDTEALERALESVDDMLREMEAEREVDRLLAEADRE